MKMKYPCRVRALPGPHHALQSLPLHGDFSTRASRSPVVFASRRLWATGMSRFQSGGRSVLVACYLNRFAEYVVPARVSLLTL